jgi:nitrate/nitrite-specific signal transduction histidine kinase
MRRRAAAIGADLQVESRPGGGTTIRLLFEPRAREKGRVI